MSGSTGSEKANTEGDFSANIPGHAHNFSTPPVLSSQDSVIGKVLEPSDYEG